MRAAQQRAADPTDGRWRWTDLRLVPAAGAVWVVSLASPFLAPAPLATAAAGAIVAGWGARRRGSARAAVLLAVLAAVAVTCGTSAVRSAARETSPLTAWAEQRRTVTVDLELDADPHLLAGSGRPRIVADATVTAVHEGARIVRLDAPVLLFAPEEGWRGLLPGQPVRARMGTAPPEVGDEVVAVLSAVARPRPWGKRTAGRSSRADCATGWPTPRRGCSIRARPGCCRGSWSVTPAEWIRSSTRTSGGRGSLT